MRRLSFIAMALLLATPIAAQGAPKAKPTSLNELLSKVRAGWKADRSELKKREAEFRANKNKQASMLKKARARLAAAQKRSEQMEHEFELNEASMVQLEKTLEIRLGTMGELFGVIRQVAGDTRSHLDASLISAQLPGRGDQLKPLTKSKSLPSIKELEKMWFMLQQEMVESGKVVRFEATVVNAEGQSRKAEVIRVGVFNAVADGKYLNWLPEVGKLVELGRQPGQRYLSTAVELAEAQDGIVRLAVDPSRGSVLSLLVQTPSFMERIHYGGLIGYIIIGVGLFTIAVALLLLLWLLIVSSLVRLQKKRPAQNTNPLGRIMLIQQKNSDWDTDTLERKLDEVILHESAKMDRFLWLVKIVSVVAPLMGLLGTVTGMIQTFQSITLFGTGDPKLMAGGISEALATTMLGLMAAIPLVLLHSWMKSISRRIVDMLEQQSAGIIASCTDQETDEEPSDDEPSGVASTEEQGIDPASA